VYVASNPDLKLQAAEIGISQRDCGVTLRVKVRSCEVLETLNAVPLFRTERS